MEKTMKRLVPAFTFFEVILAIGVLIVAVSVVADIQLRTLLRLEQDQDEVEKIFLIKKELYDQYLNPPEIPKKIPVRKLEKPEIDIDTQIHSVQPKSSLTPIKDQINVVHSIGRWKLDRKQRTSSIVTFVLKSDEQKEKEKEKK